MDGKVSVRGFSLVELLVAVAILGIFLAIAVPPFNRWRIKASIESDTKSVYALIQKARTIAFSRKIDLTVQASSKTVCIYSGNSPLGCTELSNPFSGSVGVSRRGYFSQTGSIAYAGSADVEVNYNCVVVSVNRARLGVLSGGQCVPK